MDVDTSAGIGRRLLPLGLVFLSVGLATAMAGPFTAIFLTDAVHADGTQVAVFLVAAPLAGVAVSTVVGRLSDRLPSRRGLLASTALAGCAGAAVTAVVRDYAVLLLVTVTLTATAGTVMAQVFAHAREGLEGSDRVVVALSSLRSLFSAAWVAGPPLAAALLRTGGFTVVYAASSALYAMGALAVLTAPHGRRSAGASGLHDKGVHRTDPDRARPRSSPPETPGRLLLWVAVLVLVLVRCAGMLALQGLPLFTTRVVHGGVAQAGWLLGLCAALEIPLMVAAGVLATRIPLPRLVIGGIACAVAYLTVVAVSTTVWPLAVGQVLNAASVAVTTGLGITYLQDLLPGRPGWAATLYGNASAIGAVLAGPVLGAAQGGGYRMPYVVGAVLCAVALVLFATTHGGLAERHVTGDASPPRRR